MERISRQHDAFALTRARESFADWFAAPPRITQHSIVDFEHLLGLQPEMVVVRGDGETHPITSGAISGSVGGAAMLSVAALLAKTDLPTTIGSMVSRGWLEGTPAFAAAWVFVMLVGAVIGGGFAQLTRRLRNLPALLCFGMLLSGTAWLFLQLVVLQRFAPAISHALPAAPMLLGAIAFGLVTALQLPLRTRRLF
ncbi:MAG: hypothetical protein ACXWUG_03180 [Polyangiales bacterium]